MRIVATGTGERLRLKADQRARLKEWLVTEHKKALDGRFGLENTWRQAIRAYQGDGADEPERRWRPFAGAPRVEITLGAEICDTVLSQAEDLIFQVHPPLMVRSRKGSYDKGADAMQSLVNHGVESGFWNFEQGIKLGLIDCVQLGPAIWYVPFTRTVRVTDVRKVVTVGPRISAVAPEHFILPSGAEKDVQQAKFCTMRTFMSKSEVKLRARLNNWTIDDAAGSDSDSLVTKDRRRAVGVGGGGYGGANPICVGQTWCYFDLNEDGIDCDIVVTWNMLTGGIMKVSYNQYNYRPFVLECYQDRGHVAYGMGVMEMVMPYERAVSEIWNNHIWNMMVSNTKAYTGPSSAMQEVTDIYPGKYMPNDENQKIEPIDMGEVNATGINAVSLMLTMAKERVGVQALASPVRAASRTPAGSMMSALQQANRRFTHPFNNMRNGAGQAVMQCLYRLQEEVRGGNKEVINKIEQILEEDEAQEVLSLMRKKDVELSDALDVQLVVSSVSVNREADRQNMVMLSTQVIPLYWNAKKELAQFISMPPFPGADEIAKNANKVLDKIYGKIMKTFDQISDVRALQISLDELHPMAEHMDGMMGQLQQGQQGPQGAPAPGAPPQGMMQ